MRNDTGRPGRRSAVLLAAVATATGVLGGCGGGQSADLELRAGARAHAEAFFERYMDADGRVVRRDQGGDTVSEGQAYAMLLSVAHGDRSRFERAWRWAREHLRRDDGLLSWHWKDGEVVDASPAADADVDAARALVLAGRRFGAPEHTRAGVDLAEAIVDHETTRAGDDLVLMAGPWAVDPRIVNPSYLAVCAFAELEEATGDGRWSELRSSAERILDELTDDGALPPDWATLDRDGRPQPSGPPGGADGEPRYGLDAVRVAVRLAEGCDGPGREIASRLWPRLRDLDGGGAAVAYALDGDRLDGAEHPSGLVAAAAAAAAAGDGEAADRLLSRAAALDRRYPTYYGSAWVALGHTWVGDGSQPEDA